MSDELLELAERVEKATGPDDALDAAIWLAVKADAASRKAYDEGLKLSKQEAQFRLSYMSDGFRPTASLDAAMTLVPERSQWTLEPNAAWLRWLDNDDPSGVAEVQAQAATTALALCAAALRSKHKGGE